MVLVFIAKLVHNIYSANAHIFARVIDKKMLNDY